jgi:adenylate cyclase
MGIGINTGDAVVGNIGSSKRTKYGIVGRNVNLTARIESYTVGGQIMVSESTLNACGPILRIDSQMEVMPKGVKQPITIYEIGGIGGEYNIFLPEKQEIALQELAEPITVEFIILEGKHAGDQNYAGKIVNLHKTAADIAGERGCRELTNLKLSVFDAQGNQLTDELYAKVKKVISSEPQVFRIYFTSVPPNIETFFKASLA